MDSHEQTIGAASMDAAATAHAHPGISRDVWIILATLAVDAVGLGVAIPVLPDLLAAVGARPAQVPVMLASLIACFYFMQFVFGPLVGSVSDSWGRRPVLLLALGGCAASYAIGATARGYGWLLAGHVLAGITASSAAVATAYLADVTPPALRSRRFALASSVLGLGLIAGPAFGGLLGALGPRVPFIAAGAVALLNFVSAAFFLRESLPVQRRVPFSWARASLVGSLRLVRRDRVFRSLLCAVCCGMIAYGIYLSCFVLANTTRLGWGPRENGFALAGLGLGITLTQTLLLPRLVTRLGEHRTALLGFGLFVLAYGVYSQADSVALIVVALVLHSLSLISDPSVRSLISVHAGAQRQGEYQGALVCLTGLASSIAPLLGGKLFDYFARPGAALFFPGVPFIFAALLYALAMRAVWRAMRGHARTVRE
ncbi:transporter [Burkholderia singularis]|uniref:Transporter n=1 Tax=Burkholderia singularis TaxID=1503053 RepID=A0A118DQG2_9BURK|nr:MFS transporter [Burkholderia singularis]KVE29484.1 transporter [Burkholderia singularis]